jgi:hypothetical protein
MRFAVLLLTLATSAMADPISEVTGNWAGAQNTGFYFRAVLLDDAGHARLQIWNAMDAVPQGGDPQFDNAAIVFRDNMVEAGEQRLELLDGPDGTALQVVTDASDEEYTAREVLTIQYMDNQFTVMAYENTSSDVNTGGDGYACIVDVWNDKVSLNGVANTAPQVAFEDKNASGWTATSAFDLGYCPRPE